MTPMEQIAAEEQMFEKASGLGYEGPRMRRLSNVGQEEEKIDFFG